MNFCISVFKTYFVFICSISPLVFKHANSSIHTIRNPPSSFANTIFFGDQPHKSSKINQCDFAMEQCSKVVLNLNKKNLEDCPVDIAYLKCLKSKEYSRICSGSSFYDSQIVSIQNSIKEKCKKDKNSKNRPVLPPPLKKKSNPKCVYKRTLDTTYKTCLIYGDPHLRDFTAHHQTCRILGSWPLVDNHFFSIQISQKDVVEGAAASAVTKVTVIIRRKGECLEEKLTKSYYSFTAMSKYGLPLSFDDGSSSLADGVVSLRMIHPSLPNSPQLKGKSNSLLLQENRYKLSKQMPQEREILLNHIDTKIILRQIDSYISVAIHTPDTVARESGPVWQLCKQGCPPQEQQPHKESLLYRQTRSEDSTIREISVSEAEASCRKYPLIGAFFHNCVFDYLMTKDIKVIEMASLAQNDLYSLQGGIPHSRYLSNQTRYIEYRPSWLPMNLSKRHNCDSICTILTATILMLIYVFV